MDRGWVKLWVKTLDSPVFQHEGMFRLWIWCLLRASRTKRQVQMTTGKGKTTVTLERGQLVVGRNSLSDALNVKPSTIRNWLGKLKEAQNLDIQTDTHWSVITIRNYEQYQEDPKKRRTGKRTGNGQAMDTVVEVESGVEDKSKTPPLSPPPGGPPPVIEALRLGLGRYPAKHLWPAILEQVNGTPIDTKLLTTHAMEWAGNGWNKSNFLGVINFHKEKLGITTSTSRIGSKPIPESKSHLPF